MNITIVFYGNGTIHMINIYEQYQCCNFYLILDFHFQSIFHNFHRKIEIDLHEGEKYQHISERPVGNFLEMSN